MKNFFLSFIVSLVIFSCNSKQKSFDFQGHRGAMGLSPENTIPSFTRALDEGVTTVEFDVVISKDSLVVVSHEPWFRSTICLKPDGSKILPEEEQNYIIFQLPYDEIALFDCGSLQNPRFPEQENFALSKPLMRDAILAMDKHAIETGRTLPFFNIETKSLPQGDNTHHPEPSIFMQLVYDELADLDVLDRVIIQSFDPRTLQYLRELDSNIPQAYLMYEPVDVQLGIEQLGYIPEIFSPYFRNINPDIVAHAHSKGMLVIPWTVNEIEDMERLVTYGVDGLISDYPNRFNKLSIVR